MALKDWTLPTSTIALPGGEIAVRGLSVDAVAALVRDDRAAILAAFDQITGKANVQQLAAAADAGEETPDVDLAELGMGDAAASLLQAAPGLVAKIIAWAADEPDAVEQARQIPMPLQLEILVEIGRLTFEMTSPGKFLETVITLARSANTGLAAAKQMRR